MHISFLADSLANSATSAFGAGTISNSFTVHRNTVSYGFGSTQTTILFAGGGVVTLEGGVFEGASGTNIFSNTTGSTGNFGIAGILPTFS